MRAKAKYMVIYRHKEQYPISVMCQFFRVCLISSDEDGNEGESKNLYSQEERAVIE